MIKSTSQTRNIAIQSRSKDGGLSDIMSQKSSKQNTNVLTRRESALLEQLFDFYCKQDYIANTPTASTFEVLQNNSVKLSMPSFLKMMKDFEVKHITRQSLMREYNRVVKQMMNCRQLRFQDFLQVIQSLFGGT